MKLIYKTAYLSIILIVFTSCNKIQLGNLDYKNYEPYLSTFNYNFQRNALSSSEVVPPLKLFKEDDFSGLASNGFTFTNNILFFATGKGYVFALNAKNLEELGKKKLGLASTIPPTIYKNILYQTFDSGDNGLIAYDIQEGDILWELEKNWSSSSVVVFENKVYFQNNKGKMSCFNYQSGETIWEMDLKCFGKNNLAFNHGIIISTNQNGSVFALEFSSGIILWKKEFDDQIFADPAIFDNRIYIATYKGNLFQLDIKSGQIYHKINYSVPFYYAVTIDDNGIYIPASTGEIFKINKNNFIKTWSFKGSGPAASSAVVSENLVYFSTLGKSLYIIDKNSGSVLQEIKLEGRIRSLPLIHKDKLVIACEDDYVNIFASSK